MENKDTLLGPQYVGIAVSQARKARGWSQEELAKTAGLTPATISELERGKRSARHSTLRRIASAMNLDLGALVRGELLEKTDSAQKGIPNSQVTISDLIASVDACTELSRRARTHIIESIETWSAVECAGGLNDGNR